MDRCGAVSPSPATCGRKRGHEGEHIADDSWPDGADAMQHANAVVQIVTLLGQMADALRKDPEASYLVAKYDAMAGQR